MKQQLSIPAESWELCCQYMEWCGMATMIVFGICAVLVVAALTVCMFGISLCIVLLSRFVDWTLCALGGGA